MRGLKWLDDERIRYLIVGVWNTAFGYVLFLALLGLLGNPLRALASSSSPVAAFMGRNYYVIIGWIGWVVAVPQSTLAMKYFAFRSKGAVMPQIGRAYFVYLPAQAIGSAILWLTVRVIGLTPQIGALVVIVVTTVFSYLGHKYFTFKTPLEVGEVYDAGLLGHPEGATEHADAEHDGQIL